MRGFLPRSLRLLGVVFAVAASWRCAHVEPPSGGPEDRTPPAVAAVYPAPGAARVPADASTIFQFTEWIDRATARGQVIVSPPFPGRLRVEAEEDRITVRPPAGRAWRPGTTHTVTVLGGLKDLRGNAMGGAFALRFSTGAAVDSGAAISGRLVREERRGTLVAALYPVTNRGAVEALSPRDADFRPAAAPEPWRELPTSLAAADSQGNFRAAAANTAAKDERYTLFAFEDVNGNFAFDLGLEAAATGALPVADPARPAPALRLLPMDTLPLRLLDVTFEPDPADSVGDSVRGLAVLRFSRAPHPARAAEVARYTLLPDGGAALSARGIEWNPVRGAWALETPTLRVGVRHRVALRARPDFPGRAGADAPDTSVAFEVTPAARGAIKPESWTLAPVRPASGGPDGLPSLAPFPPAARELPFASNLPLTPARWAVLEARLLVRVGSDSAAPAPVRVRRTGPSSLVVAFVRPPRGGSAVFFRLASTPLGASRPAGRDTLSTLLYAGTLADSAQAGAVRFAPRGDASGMRYWLSPATGSVATAEHALAPAGGAWRADGVPPGLYRLLALRDADGDGVWNPGALKPWIPQEPVETVSESVLVEAGGTTEVTEPTSR